MSSWSGGYVTDIDYLSSYFREHTPAHMALAALLCGFETPDPAQPFTFVELGCATGLSLMVAAAANPHGTFVGMDFMPGHIARANALKQAAGLENVHFYEASFEDWLHACPVPAGSADFMVAHGIYSWVTEDNVARVRTLFGRLLRPGGMAQLSYNCYPGWTMGMVLRRVVMEGAALTHGPSNQRAVAGLKLARMVNDMTDSKAISQPLLERFEGHATTERSSYLAHELLNEAWHVRFSPDVVAEMADEKLTFVAHGALTANIPSLNLSQELLEFLEDLPSPSARLLLEDVGAGRGFRRDIYIKGPSPMPAYRKQARLDAVNLTLGMSPQAASLTLDLPIGTVELDQASYRPILEALLDGPQSIGSLAAMAAARGGKAPPERIATLLVGPGYANPDFGVTAPTDRVRRFSVEMARWLEIDPVRINASVPGAVGGCGAMVDAFELQGLRHLLSGVAADATALARAIYTDLMDRGEEMSKDGEVLKGEAAHMDHLSTLMTGVVQRELPVWRSLGIVD